MSLRLYHVMKRTKISQITIQTELGSNHEKLFKSEVGHTLKSSIINNILETQRNCNTKLSYLVYFAREKSQPANIINIKREIKPLNQKIPLKSISPDNKNIICSESLFLERGELYLNQI